MVKEDLSYEKEILKYWKDNKIYEKVQKYNSNGKLFNHIDGPPYPTGEVHLGHLRNWAIKDSVLRFRRFQGYNVYARDGYDTHGLPVENKTQNKLGLKTVAELRKFGVGNFIKECKKYAKSIIWDMKDIRDRFGLWMDRDAYYTFHSDYISLSWRFFKEAEKKGLLYKDYKTVAWCPHDETTLSDYEIKDTYKEIEDPSIYVKFSIKSEFKKSSYPEYLLIWTTTPWTLQSNMLVAVNPIFEYVYVLLKINGKEEVWIFAKSVLEQVIAQLKTQNDIVFEEVLQEVKGSELKGIKYDHIYLEETPSQQEFVSQDIHNLHSVVLADFVTLSENSVYDKLEKKGFKHSLSAKKSSVLEEKDVVDGSVEVVKDGLNISNGKDGTGLVHIAPGHGFDDFEVGKRENVPIFCPVGPDGKMLEGKFKGVYFKDVDPLAIKYLREKGFLVGDFKKKHRYPCCWRCKTPIVYRAAEQWWIKRSAYLKDNIKVNNGVKWVPHSAKVIFNNLMKNAGDWAISRQRFWGTPLPIFEDEDGNYEVFGSKEELEEKIGKKLDDLHLDVLREVSYINAKSGKVMKIVPFITDVWFDSGSASFASHYGEGLSFSEIMEKYYPIKWITESEDQIRGWFSSLMNVGQVMTGKAPYNEVLFYGFVMDKNGQKMSKSLGNGISGNDAINRFGVDRLRYFLLKSKLPEEKINFDLENVETSSSMFNTLENLLKFVNDYLKEYEVRDTFLDYKNLDVEDKWILAKLNRLILNYERLFEEYRINVLLKELEEFIVKDLSKIYLKIVKERTVGRDDNLLAIFRNIVKKVLILLAPIAPFFAEFHYLNSFLDIKKESIFLESYPSYDGLIIKEAEKYHIEENFDFVMDIVGAILNAREKIRIGVRWPLPEVNIVLSDNVDLSIFDNLFKSLTNVKKIKYDFDDVQFSYIVKPNFVGIKRDFKEIGKVVKVINLNKFYISEDLKKGFSSGSYDGVNLDYDKHIIKEIELNGDFVSNSVGKASIILHTAQDEVLLEEGFVRELVRRVQEFRKELSFVKKDKILISFAGSDQYFEELISLWDSFIMKKVNAEEILLKSLKFEKEFVIKGKRLVISLEKRE